MQNKKLKNAYVLLAVPIELLAEAEIFAGDPVQMYVENNKLILESIDADGGIVCDGDCDSCPLGDEDCDNDCEHCPCFEACDESEVD